MGTPVLHIPVKFYQFHRPAGDRRLNRDCPPRIIRPVGQPETIYLNDLAVYIYSKVQHELNSPGWYIRYLAQGMFYVLTKHPDQICARATSQCTVYHDINFSREKNICARPGPSYGRTFSSPRNCHIQTYWSKEETSAPRLRTF